MKRKWAAGVCLVAAFILLAAALALHLKGIADVSDASYMDEQDKQDLDIPIQRLHACFDFPDDRRSFLSTVNRFILKFPSDGSMAYNIVCAGSNGEVLYKLNENYISGKRVVFLHSGSRLYINDPLTGKSALLQFSDSSGPLPADVGNAAELDAANTAIANQNGSAPDGGTKNINVDFDYNLDDGAPPDNFIIWLYDDATKVYIATDHYASLRSAGMTLEALGIAALAAYGLLLALWVFLDALGLQRRRWQWAALTLIANLAGFMVYVVARSQGFGAEPGIGCSSCGKPMEKEWARCPYCGNTEVVQQ